MHPKRVYFHDENLFKKLANEQLTNTVFDKSNFQVTFYWQHSKDLKFLLIYSIFNLNIRLSFRDSVDVIKTKPFN